MNRIFTILIQVILLAILAGCSRPAPDAALTRIDATIGTDPEKAVSMLDSIDPRKLSVSDRHFFDFLTVKAMGRAYIPHESDSLILDVIDYYSDEPTDPIYAQSLYYGGRGYSDLGDYPTALQYYQQALDNLDKSSDTDDLWGRLNSQIGMLLQDLRLYNRAIPYFDKVLDQKIKEQDSVVIVYTLQRLGDINYNLNRLDKADSLLTRSLDYSVSLPESFSALSKVLLAAVKLEKGDIGTALSLIRNTPDNVKPATRNVALAFGADIYLAAGIPDTAYLYAHELVTNKEMSNKKTGYRILTSPEFHSFLHPDTLSRYYVEYKQILEEYFDENTNTEALMQETAYNYRLHDRERQKAQKDSERMRWIIAGCLFIVLVLTVIILYVKFRSRDKIIKLQETLNKLERLGQEIHSTNESGGQDIPDSRNHMELTGTDIKESLREQIRCKAMELSQDSENMEISSVILELDVYSRLQELLSAGNSIPDAMWEELKNMVLTVSPRFITNLRILTRNRLSDQELHSALLIKCGFRPAEMTILLARSNGAIVSRRITLGIKILGEKHSVTVIDGIIRAL